ISCFVSLTLSPALAAILLKPHSHEEPKGFLAVLSAPLRWFFKYFNKAFDWLSHAYGAVTSRLIRFGVIMLLVYAGLIAVAGQRLAAIPTGLVPQLDRGYFIAVFQLPPGSSLPRTDAVIRKATDILLSRPGVAHA
ncbi:efflux RND transporter permease subunit, partial [Staphylococcus coagulans]|uniref:efflux RND transporter permease subunit n=1 Tax=Staphylococcus coagulans TaxID=74706 RepID=UPI001BE901DB